MADFIGGPAARFLIERFGIEDQAVHIEDDSLGPARELHYHRTFAIMIVSHGLAAASSSSRCIIQTMSANPVVDNAPAEASAVAC
jgi:hypothetical protein